MRCEIECKDADFSTLYQRSTFCCCKPFLIVRRQLIRVLHGLSRAGHPTAGPRAVPGHDTVQTAGRHCQGARRKW